MLFRWPAWTAVLGFVWVASLVAPVSAQNNADKLAQVLLLDDVVEILHQEGLRYGEVLNESFLGGQGGDYFASQVVRIYDKNTMLNILRESLAREMSEEAVAGTLDFFDTPLGQRILRLEVTAREAMADPAIEQMAQDAFETAEKNVDQRLDTIQRYIDVNDLEELNVAGALGSNYQFYLGLVEGGSHRMTDGEITDEVWSQEQDIRAEITVWLNSYLFLAYSPLTQAEMMAYLDYSETAAGQSLNAALFDGFDKVFRTVYYALGIAVARSVLSSEL